MSHKSIIIKIVFFAFALSIGACATPYQPVETPGLPRGGYSELRMSEKVWQVKYHVNGYTAASLAEDYVLRRCAELTAQCGFPFFVVMKQKWTRGVHARVNMVIGLLTEEEAKRAPLAYKR